MRKLQVRVRSEDDPRNRFYSRRPRMTAGYGRHGLSLSALLASRRGRAAVALVTLYAIFNGLFLLLAIGKDQWWRGIVTRW